MTKFDRVNPFADQDVTQQLDSWAAALEMAVAALNQTLAEVRLYQEKGVADVPPARTECDAGEGADGDSSRSDSSA